MRHKTLVFVALLVIAFLNACSSSSTTPAPPAGPQFLYATDFTSGKIFVYQLPASATAVPTVTLSTGFTTLYASAISGGVLYVDNNVSPAVIYGYTLPLTATSAVVTTINTTGTSNAFGFTFDPAGNLWLADQGNSRLLGYHGPFSGVSTPTPFTTITTGITSPWNVTTDAAGNLYDANGTAVAVLDAPPSTISLTLSALSEPIPMQVDSAGNLYVADFATGNLYRYNAPLSNAETPSITDPKANTTLVAPYFMALDSAGNLYVSDCSGSVKVFATGTFSATSAPSYALPLPSAACSTGLAIH
ncbi:MAG: hypothetical protein JO219_00720 [Candidatus Eremiobacteraeota bacterium]|nr:hypothetical protein [Candidatus Eremiobacteraeota bacterium]